MKNINEKKKDYLPPRMECIEFDPEGVIAMSAEIQPWGSSGDGSDKDDWDNNGD